MTTPSRDAEHLPNTQYNPVTTEPAQERDGKHLMLDPRLWTDDDRRYWDGKKLLAEERKTRLEGNNARFSIVLQFASAVASAGAVTVAVVGLLLSSAAQRRQADDAAFATALSALMDSRSNLSLAAAVATLGSFTNDPVRRHRMLGPLVERLSARDEPVTQQIIDLLLAAPDPAVLETLAAQNRRLVARLARVDTVNVEVV
jgi:hypothetical protein